jgi:putative transposase
LRQKLELACIQPDHVHLLIKVPPKQAISDLMGTLKGRTAIKIFKQSPYLKEKSYWVKILWRAKKFDVSYGV